MTHDGSVRGWIETRTPPVPEGCETWMAPASPHAEASVTALVLEARQSLTRVQEADDRSRLGAFDLLAADGFVTWACESALEQVDPVASLTGIVDALLE